VRLPRGRGNGAGRVICQRRSCSVVGGAGGWLITG